MELTIVDYCTAAVSQTSTTEPKEAETHNNLRKINPILIDVHSSLSNPIVFTQLKVTITKAKTTGTSWQCRHSRVSRVKSEYSG